MGLTSGQYTNLFEVMGEYVQRINDYVTIISDLETDRSQIEAEMQANSAPLNLYRDNTDIFDNFKSTTLSWITQLTSKIETVLNNDELVLDQFTTTSGWDGILLELIPDMISASQTIKKSTITIGSVTDSKTNSTAGTVLIDGVLDGYSSPGRGFSAREDYNGVSSELAPTSDAMVIACTSDSVVSGISEGSEKFAWGGSVGEEGYTTNNSGTGAGPALSTLQSLTTTISNADFETWTDGTTPGTWTESSGTVTRSASPYKGTYACSFVGDGSTVMTITQAVAGSFDRKRRYCVACYVKGQTGIAAGALEIMFTGTGYTAGGTEKISMDASALAAATGWTLKHFYINMPNDIPSDLKLSIDVKSGLTNAKTVIIDQVMVGPVVYNGGVNAVVVMGAGVFRKNDTFSFSLSNNNSGVFQTFFRKGLGLQLPSAASPTIADSLASD